MNFKPIIKSPKTTTAAILVAISELISTVSVLLDNDPGTEPNWQMTITMIVAAVGLLFARDGDVSSEKSGLK